MRLIDADALREFLVRAGRFLKIQDDKRTAAHAVGKIIEHIDNMQTIDAEPVVRCKDCKHRGTDDCPMHYKGVPADEDFLKKVDNDFCSYGERRSSNK